MRLPSRTTLRAAGAAAIAVAALVATGCGGGSSSDPDLEAGKQLFVQSCGACHTLLDAGTQATIGPDLDDAYRASRQAGFKESQFEGVTRRWIRAAQQPMPRDLVTGQDANDVAAYVARVAGTDEGSAVRPAPPFDRTPRYGDPSGANRAADFAPREPQPENNSGAE